jgi:hypothetical protein
VGYHLAFGCMACASIKHATHGCQPFTVKDSPTDAVGCIGLKVVVCMANHHTGEPSKGSHKMHFRFIWTTLVDQNNNRDQCTVDP